MKTGVTEQKSRFMKYSCDELQNNIASPILAKYSFGPTFINTILYKVLVRFWRKVWSLFIHYVILSCGQPVLSNEVENAKINKVKDGCLQDRTHGWLAIIRLQARYDYHSAMPIGWKKYEHLKQILKIIFYKSIFCSLLNCMKVLFVTNCTSLYE